MFNTASLISGIVSWACGIAAVEKRGCPWWIFASIASCCGAMLFQLMEVRRRVALSDWSALMDTIDAVVLAAAVLLVGTVALNLTALLRGRKDS